MLHLWMLAAVPVEAAEKEMSGVLKFLLENPFAIGLTLLFLAAVVGAFIAARQRDRCLKRFRGFPVTIEEQSGRTIWGRLRVFSKGLELEFETGDAGGTAGVPAKNSFLIYEPEVARILAIRRFADSLSGRDAARRRRQAERLADPPLASRLGRRMRNIVNTFRDAIVQALGMSIQQASKAAPNPLLATGGTQISGIGATLIGTTANAYEPMLEQYIGKPVVLELVNPADAEKRGVEYHGYLGEYSAQFVLLVDARRRPESKAPPAGGDAVEPDGRLFDLLVPRACGTVRHASAPTKT
ncbi:MAG: hypothetical protein WBD63_00445 [Phycisphaerae bacterium]|nr:hypothetical protein [Phycisphaerae bacterium]